MKLFRYLLIVAFLLPLFSSCGYNSMVKKEESLNAQWANVENAYQRRSDLLPNLVNTVKGYAEHEKETLKEVVEARAKATAVNVDPDKLNAQSLLKFQQAQSGLAGALSKLMVVVEKYPDLKANANFLSLQDQLEGTENRISTERRRFNELVKDYNQYIRKFPALMVANMFGFDEKPYFKAEETAKKVPKVEF